MSTLLQTLINTGILPSDAAVLENHFSNVSEIEFLDDLEIVARALAIGELPALPPSSDPWLGIYSEMQQGGDLDQAFNHAISKLDTGLQLAIMGAVSVRVSEIKSWLKDNQLQGKRKTTAQYINALKKLGYSFRFNLCTNEVEVNNQKITDQIAQDIRTKVRDVGLFETNIIEDAYGAEAWRNQYHPIKDYLMSLSFRGGDPITELSTYFEDEHNVLPLLLRRFLVGSCARVMAGEQNRMLVLDGAQGLGKDHFAKWIASPLPEYFYEGPIMPDEKDHRIRLTSTWIWNVNELGSTTRRSDREALKAFLTIQIVRERKAYGRYDSQGKALASFIGTVNNEGGILNDPTGHRRYMVAHVKSIDWSYTSLDVDQIWAQAFDLYLSGESWMLSGDELKRVNDINEEYQVTDIVEETLKELFEITPGDTSYWMSTVEIMEVMKAESNGIVRGGGLRPGSEIDTRRLASALTKLGLVKTNPLLDTSGRRRRGYNGIKIRNP